MAQDYKTLPPLSSKNDPCLVVDLSMHMSKLQAYEDISDDLTEEQECRLTEYVRNAMKMSYDKISKRYDHWQEADRAHDVYVPADTTKFREKAVMADTRAIADTVLTYMMSALAGRNPMFQLEAQNRTSRIPSAILERLLHQHMRRTSGEARVAQMLMDSIRYGFAPTKIIWNPKKNTNDIINFDPRRVFPDPRVQWGDWDKMQFIVFTDFCSTNSLISTSMYPKLQKYPALRTARAVGSSRWGWDAHNNFREEGRGHNIDPLDPVQIENGKTTHGFSLQRARVIDEAWVRLNGFEINCPQIEQIWLVISILDEGVVVRCQLNPNGRQFPVVIGGLYHDAHKTYSQSLYDLMLPLHNISTWMLRSRIDNVQAALNNLMFVDPSVVNVADLIDRNPWGLVRTLPGAKPGDGLYIAQIPDVTRSHWGDIAQLNELKQRVSAASDAQQGMPTADGVRTATEIQRLTQLGSQRLGVLSRIISATTMRPMVEMMVSNLQDAVNLSGSIKAPSNSTPGLLTPLVDNGYIDFDVQDLQGQIEYLVVDGTLPVEPTRNAETWLNILQVMQETGLNMEYNMGKIAEEGIRSMGVPDIEQFKISKEEAAQGTTPSQQLALLEKMRGASVVPQGQLDMQIQQGNVVPLRGK